MNIGDLIDDFICEVRERGGFANDRDFDLIVGRVFAEKIKAAITEEREACVTIATNIKAQYKSLKRDHGEHAAFLIENLIRARSEGEKKGE